MKKFLALAIFATLLSCNNKKDKTDTTTETTNDGSTTTPSTNTAPAGSAIMKVNLDGQDLNLNASALISKDKKNLQAGAPLFAMVTASDGPNDESVTLNFVFDTRPGSYPVVGVGISRGSGDSAQVFGGLLGGEPKITSHKVNLTEVKDLGDNNLGGHKWSISGTFGEMTVPAMELMLINKNHPKETIIKGGSFTNLVFDDNMDEILEKAFDKMKENK